MQDLKISLITVTFNAEKTIEQCIRSVIGQTYKNVEYIVIDGNSTDKTIQVINKYKNYIHLFLSEPDEGIYDGMNKGIKFATGDIAGILNADDFFSDEDVLRDVAGAFRHQNAEILYGDLDCINNQGKIVRKWRSGNYRREMFDWGWMPPHPTFYCRRELFYQHGFYSLDYGTAADYELMLRFMYKHHVNAFYLEKVMVKMKIGGASNKSLSNRVKGLLNDFRAMRSGGIPAPLSALFFKPFRKVGQYFKR